MGATFIGVPGGTAGPGALVGLPAKADETDELAVETEEGILDELGGMEALDDCCIGDSEEADDWGLDGIDTAPVTASFVSVRGSLMIETGPPGNV